MNITERAILMENRNLQKVPNSQAKLGQQAEKMNKAGPKPKSAVATASMTEAMAAAEKAGYAKGAEIKNRAMTGKLQSSEMLVKAKDAVSTGKMA